MPSRDESDWAAGEGVSAPPVPPRRAVRRGSVRAQAAVKCVLVGDGAVGKSSLVVSYTTNGYPAHYIPTTYDTFTAKVVVDGRPVRLQLCDMAGQAEFERLRPLCYDDTDVVLLCYSVILPSSFRNVMERWAPEVRRLCPGVPMILVGTQADLREDVQVLIRLAEERERPVGQDEARLCAQNVGAMDYVECSALTQKNLKEVFDLAIVASLQHVQGSGPGQGVGLRGTQMLREKTPDKIRQLSETWWKKLSCLV